MLIELCEGREVSIPEEKKSTNTREKEKKMKRMIFVNIQ